MVHLFLGGHLELFSGALGRLVSFGGVSGIFGGFLRGHGRFEQTKFWRDFGVLGVKEFVCFGGALGGLGCS